MTTKPHHPSGPGSSHLDAPCLKTRYLGIELAHPCIASASPLTHEVDSLIRLEEAGAAAVVLPSLFEEQIVHDLQSFADVRHASADSFAESLSYFPDFAAPPSVCDQYLKRIERARSSLSIPVIASLNGTSRGGWTSYARMLEDAGAHAIELNVYVVPTDPRLDSAAIDQLYVDLVAEVRETVSVPLAVKVGPYFSALPHLAHRMQEAGANGLVLFNRYLAPDIDLDHLEFQPDLVLSRPDELRLALRWIAILRDQLSISLGATGGIHDVRDVVKALLVGSDAVLMASALLRHGADHLRYLTLGLSDWLREHGYASVSQIKGSMSRSKAPNPEGLERANYMQTLIHYTTTLRPRTQPEPSS